MHAVNQKKKKQRKYIDSYNKKGKKMIAMHTVNQKNKKIEIFAQILCREYMFIVK